MGKHLGNRGETWINYPYIVNLTTNIIGKNALTALAYDECGRDGHALRVFFWERIEKEVAKMTNDTLAQICAYGGPRGLHVGPACRADFLNMTGYKDVMNWTLDPTQNDGRGILEELSILTIVCVVRDIIMQRKWQTDFLRELDENEELDQGMKDYIHHGHR